MNSLLAPRFLQHYRVLPEEVRAQARQAYSLFQQNPHHPSLRFRQVHPTRPIFSARVGASYRAIGLRDGNTMTWFWIGSHSEYDQILKHV